MFGLRYMRFLVRIARLRRIPVVLAAMGIGPLRSSEGRRIARDILNDASFVQVRDSESVRICRDLDVAAPVSQGFDPAVLLREELGPDTPRRARPLRDRLRIGVALSSSPGTIVGNDGELAQKIQHLTSGIRRARQSVEFEVAAIQMCANARANDLSICRQLTAALQGVCDCCIMRYTPDPGQMLREFARLDAVIAERLHAGVYGFAAGIPTAVIPYHEKCRAFADDVGLPPSGVFERLVSAHETARFITHAAAGSQNLLPSRSVAEACAIARRGQQSVVEFLNKALSSGRRCRAEGPTAPKNVVPRREQFAAYR
jgi:polysaccharide pyruvyl transferase WcaK-like protein